MFLSSKTSIRGHLVIHEEDQHGNKIKVFDDHNIITLEGKDHIIRYLTNSIAGVAESRL